jgi:putative flavoprotein involved in K+ transport
MKQDAPFQVIIVGAGPAGLGCAIALRQCGVEQTLVLDRTHVGASFQRWPTQMRMITPSFHSNPFGQTDLNAISPETSPGDFLSTEHPNGIEYAAYLQASVSHYQLTVREGVTVQAVHSDPEGFTVQTDHGPLRSRFVIWATGEFFFPNRGGIEGADLCWHNSEIGDWRQLRGVEHVVIGGFESGIDAAVNLARLGKTVHLLSRGQPWQEDSADPSRCLSPYTRDRLKAVLADSIGSIRFIKQADIVRIERLGDLYVLTDAEGLRLEISTRPVLCTGFQGGLGLVADRFTGDNGSLSFTEEADESPVTPGLFYSGPLLRHRQSLFCFIYKFRSRFGIVAREISRRLGLEWEEPLRLWQERGFMVEDLDCCTSCTCAMGTAAESGSPHAQEKNDIRITAIA